MKIIEIDEELYKYITIHTQYIGESKSNILRRILNLNSINKYADNYFLNKKNKNTLTCQSKNYILRKFILSENYIFKSKIVSKFITLLSILYQLDASSFNATILHIRGRIRIYFSTDKYILLKNSLSSKPKNIPLTPYWVITNTNTLRKIIIIKKLMTGMLFSKKIIQYISQSIYFNNTRHKIYEKKFNLVSK